MKRTPILITAALLALALLSCKEQYTHLEGVDYVMFAEQEQYFLIQQDREGKEEENYFSVMIAATTTSERDRTFGVEVVDSGSNAIENLHYRLLSNSVTIPAGERAGEVRVKGFYDNIEPTDSLGFILRLVVPEKMEWNALYENATQTKVVMYKSCPYDINNFTGWAIVSSMLIQSYPGDNVSYQRIVQTKIHPTEVNTIIVEDCFYDGYDLRLRFNPDDPNTKTVEDPIISMEEGQVVSDEGSVLGMFHGDNRILGTTSPYYDSYYNSCQRFVVLWTEIYVEDMGEYVGTIGHFYNIIEWISEEEAKDLIQQLS